jgi:hypothetical protein
MAAIGTLVEQPENRAALVEIELSVGSRHKEGSIVQAAAKPTESHFALETTPPTDIDRIMGNYGNKIMIFCPENHEAPPLDPPLVGRCRRRTKPA